jgi:16S rRNA (uracil1498-N3)-methyltransferase
VVRVDSEKGARKLEHWQAVAVAACEQCGRNRVPEVSTPLSLGDAIAALPADSPRCLLAADAGEPLASAVINGPRQVALLIGPEGGLGDNERRFAAANGFTAYRIGPRILRTETAGLAALAALQALGGDFR